MPTNNYDSSHITKRRNDKQISNSFLTRINSSNTTSYGPVLGVYNSSIMNSVKSGSMSEYNRQCPINVGCPCDMPPPTVPGGVTNIQYYIGSIHLYWDAPVGNSVVNVYKVTPYYNNIALSSVYTPNTYYIFDNLDEYKQYTFKVNAINGRGESKDCITPLPIMMPPNALSVVMKGGSINSVSDRNSAAKYILRQGIESMLRYVAKANLGPTRGSRLMYLWFFSVVSAWRWVNSDSRIFGIHDSWDWDTNMASGALNYSDSLIWLCLVIDHVNGILQNNSGLVSSIYNCPDSVVANVKSNGEWDRWLGAWQSWYAYRSGDGYVSASTTMPVETANWSKTIIVDGVTVNDISGFGEPDKWCRLTVQGKKQGYLTYNWGDVLSTCINSGDVDAIKQLVSPTTGAQRDSEVDDVLAISGALTDEQKMMAEFWAGGPGTVSPPCMFIWFWKEFILKGGDMDANVMLYSGLDLAVHLFEGGRVTWMLKKEHMESRPIQAIRKRYVGVTVNSFNGTISGDQWVPYQTANFVTPPFADFPSGHSHFSKAFSLCMESWFGENINVSSGEGQCSDLYLLSPLFKQGQIIMSNYGQFTINRGASEIEVGVVPHNNVTLTFNKWSDMANSAGMSRLYGGIHCITAHSASQTVASYVHNIIDNAWNFSK